MGRLTFVGWILGVGTASGTRVVVGTWARSPFGSFADVMVQRPEGTRLLLAPTAAVADIVAATYAFDDVRLGPVDVGRPSADTWTVAAGPLALTARTGRRTPLGLLLRAVPAPLARTPAWSKDPVLPTLRKLRAGPGTGPTAAPSGTACRT